VYQLHSGTTALLRVAAQHRFTAANGITISADDQLLYVSTWEDGIAVVDLRSGSVKPMIHPHDICLAFIDGLYVNRGGLIAIQNGPMLPRIVEFKLGADRQQIVAMRVLERRNPAFDGITTGVIVKNELYYVANPQMDKTTGPNVHPFLVLGLRIAP
jgi:sugar lactone lactonase YvrE